MSSDDAVTCPACDTPWPDHDELPIGHRATCDGCGSVYEIARYIEETYVVRSAIWQRVDVTAAA